MANRKVTRKVKTSDGPGRAKIVLDADIVGRLAEMQCTIDEIAAFCNVGRATVYRRMKEPELAEAYEAGRARGRVSLRRLQWRHAQGVGSAAVQMTIHLSKFVLGETEKAAELNLQINNTVEVTSIREALASKLDTIAERVKNRVDVLAREVGAGRVISGDA